MSRQQKNDFDPNSLNSTKQLLEELDALMDRMLSIPVETKEEPVTPSVSSKGTSAVLSNYNPIPESNDANLDRSQPNTRNIFWRPPATNEEPKKKLSEHLAPKQVEPTSRPKTPAPKTDSEWKYHTPELNLPNPLSEEQMATLQPKPMSLVSSKLSEKSKVIAKRRRLTRLWLWPLELVNNLFDFFVGLMGPTGGWLKTPWGRYLLGFLGIAFVIGAISWQIILWLRWN